MEKALKLAILLASLMSLVMLAAPADAAARVQVHHWLVRGNYPGITLRGTWTKTARSAVIAGRATDTRKDGRWVRVTVEGRSAAGRPLADSFFFFNGGRRVYTSSPFRSTEGPPPAHAFIRACVMKNLQHDMVLGCGRWRRVF